MKFVRTNYDYHIDLLEDLTRQQPHSAPTSIIICLSRAELITLVGAEIHRHSNIETREDDSDRQVDPVDVASHGTHMHGFSVPALQLLAVSQHITLIYCPTIPSLRARLSTMIGSQEHVTSASHRLVIVDLLALHHGTSEFTLQGLSRTLAAAVSAASAVSADLNLVECKDVRDPTHPGRGSRLWEHQVPLLSGSVKIGLEGSRWAGRALTIKKIASRWFQFEDSHNNKSDR